MEIISIFSYSNVGKPFSKHSWTSRHFFFFLINESSLFFKVDNGLILVNIFINHPHDQKRFILRDVPCSFFFSPRKIITFLLSHSTFEPFYKNEENFQERLELFSVRLFIFFFFFFLYYFILPSRINSLSFRIHSFSTLDISR